MDRYEKHTQELYRSAQIPFIACERNQYDIAPPELHWHENPEFLRCIEGCGEAITAGCRYSFKPNDIMFISSGSPHCILSQNETVRFTYMIIDTDFLKENGIIAHELMLSSHVNDKKANELFDRAFNAATSEGELHTLAARTCMLDFLLYMCRSHAASEDESVRPASIDEIKKAVNYIRSNYTRDITLEQAARIAGFSVCYFSRKFKKVTGQTFTTFLNTVRCENALRLLQDGMKVSDVCFKCGFSDQSYFSRIFKQLMGRKPSEIIRQRNNKNQ